MDSPGSRPAEGPQVAPPADRLVLYSRARSSWKSVHSSESNELPASREQRDDRKGGKPAGADTVPTVRTACPATKHEKAPEEPARRGTATKARLPFLFAGGAQDVLHLPGLEEPSTHDSRSVFRGRRPVGPGGVRCRIQAGSMGAIPPHRGGRGRPGLSADRYFAEALWPIPGRSQREPPGAPSTIRIPHTKGTTPDREVVPAESEFAGSDQDGSDQEEGEITQTEGEGSGTFTQMRPRDSDSGSDETTPGRESWRSARGQELVVLSTPRPGGRGKRRPERMGGRCKATTGGVILVGSEGRIGGVQVWGWPGQAREGQPAGRQAQHTAAPAHPCQRESTKEPAADQECGAGPTESSPYYKRRQKERLIPGRLAGTSAGKAPDGRH